MSNDRIIQRIQGLLNLANSASNTSDAEATSALLKAQELMAKYNISVEEASSRAEQDIVFSACSSRDYRGFRKILAVVIARNFRCKTMLYGKEVVMVGFPDDVAAAVAAFEFAYEHALRNGSREYSYRYNSGRRTAGVFNSYVQGFIDGIDEALSAQAHALMVVVPTEVNKKFEEHTSGMRSTTANIRNNEFDGRLYSKGREDGHDLMSRKKLNA